MGCMPHIIHCDRMWKASEQVLAEENLSKTNPIPYVEIALHGDHEGIPSDCSSEEVIVQKRVRRKQEWMKNYILSACWIKVPQDEAMFSILYIPYVYANKAVI